MDYINSLQKMSMMLYGTPVLNLGSYNYDGYNPSFMGGYNCYANPYTGMNFGQMIPSIYSNPQNNTQSPATTQATGTSFNGLSEKDKQVVIDYYAKNLEPSESFKNAVVLGGVSCAVMQNPRLFIHPWNTITTSLNSKSKVNQLFKDVRKKGTPLNALWEKNSLVMEEAYSQMHRATARANSKLGLFRARYTTAEIDELTRIMKEALDANDIDKVADATETLRRAYCRNGKIFQWWDKIQKVFTKKSHLQKPLEMIDKTIDKNADEIAKNTANLLGHGGKNITLWRSFKKTGGVMAVVFGLAEIFMNWNKVTKAQQKDMENAEKGVQTNYGDVQKKQTIAKGVANSVGWAVGESLGVWAYAKLGAKVGSKIHPLFGTIAGVVIGYMAGSFGMWLAGGATKKVVGDDVVNEFEAEKMAQTQSGQVDMLEQILNDIENGKPVDPMTQQVLLNLLNQQQQPQTQQVSYYG